MASQIGVPLDGAALGLALVPDGAPITLNAGDAAGLRLDLFLQQRLPRYSRSRLQGWVRSGQVTVDGIAQKPSFLLRGGETITVQPSELPPLRAFPEELPLEILYEDPAVIAVNKPAGMVVHLGAGNRGGTLVNALLHRFRQLSTTSGEDRPGIVHRLDKDTSGVILVARNDEAHRHLAAQFSTREIEKVYLALVQGKVARDAGRIDKPIARDPRHRTRMTARLGTGRPSTTEFRVTRRLDRFTLLEVRILTGRTHQIRAHMSSLGHPVAGDRLYGAAPGPAARFFLHAWRIRFRSPASGELVTVEAPIPPELSSWLESL